MLEFEWRERGLTGLSSDDYINLVLDKTCWYSAIHPCRIGAMLGSGGRADLDPIARFGFFVGAVLQIRDDVENLTDRSESNGKDFGSDIIEGKPTLMLIHLLQTAPQAARDEALGLVGRAGDRSAWVATSGSSGSSSWSRTAARSTTRARLPMESPVRPWPNSRPRWPGSPNRATRLSCAACPPPP